MEGLSIVIGFEISLLRFPYQVQILVLIRLMGRKVGFAARSPTLDDPIKPMNKLALRLLFGGGLATSQNNSQL